MAPSIVAGWYEYKYPNCSKKMMGRTGRRSVVQKEEYVSGWTSSMKDHGVSNVEMMTSEAYRESPCEEEGGPAVTPGSPSSNPSAAQRDCLQHESWGLGPVPPKSGNVLVSIVYQIGRRVLAALPVGRGGGGGVRGPASPGRPTDPLTSEKFSSGGIRNIQKGPNWRLI